MGFHFYCIFSLCYSIGIEIILNSISHNIIVHLSLWASCMVDITKGCLDWQKE